jgi:alpha/beta hydrolase fold
MNRGTDVDRRRSLCGAAMGLVATQLGRLGSMDASPADAVGAAKPSAKQPAKGAGNKLLGPVRQVDAGDLSVGYVEAGRPDGTPVLLLHGWPHDIQSYADVTPLLAAKGYRVIVPHLRGHGTTRFLSSATPRNGQLAAIAVDAVALMDALGISKAVLAGFDWGPARPASSRRSGRSAARRSSPSAAT